jgi:peptide chain release factor 1
MSWWIERLGEVERKYEELAQKLSDPAVIGNPDSLRKYSKEHSDLTPVVNAYRKYINFKNQLEDVEEMIREERDPEVISMARDEKNTLAADMEGMEEELKKLLVPKDPMDEKNILIEVRAGTGGDEATLFVANLVRMYTRYAERKGWKVEFMSTSPTEVGGYKEVVLLIKGVRVYSQLKFEGGVHRVQRVPETESSGRIHTSAVTVAVMAEAEDVEVTINSEDIRVDTFRASGSGGQHVNVTDSAIRITHLPTGIVVSCQDEKSQHKNKAKALKVLQARVLQQAQEEQQAEQAGIRKNMVGSGDRSERIRTYNFPQGRVTDHRVNLTLYKLDAVMDGDMDEITQALVASHQAEQLKSIEGA